MGNSNTKESRNDPHGPRQAGASDLGFAHSGHDNRLRGRSARGEFGGLLGMTGAAGSSSAPERRETRQEREARRLERERLARIAERERSMREEHIDGGYLVTLGTYVGPEDFNKVVVRQLQIERRLAPFWRGLQDFSDTWTEYQIVAAARGLEVPPPDQPPPEGFLPRPSTASLPDAQGGHGTHARSAQTTGTGGFTATAAPGPSVAAASASIPTGALAGTSSPSLSSPTSPTSPSRSSSSPFKPRAKALAAALSVSSRSGSSTDLTPREVYLPRDPFVNGQPIEVFLYKNSTECPICFLTYPPYLNHTRCCDQPICSECFVQIKRADPHYPEGHGDNNENADADPEEQAGQLISEPACCPYCQQPEFGVTYDSPPFRRGLTYTSNAQLGSIGTAMSSSSTINSAHLTSPITLISKQPQTAGGAVTPTSRRRTQSLSATAPNVITTDRIRPDWLAKLASQRAHIARRAAAATALHTAAFLMGSEQRGGFRVGRFSRWAVGSGTERDNISTQGHSDGGDSGQRSPAVEASVQSSTAGRSAGTGAGGNARRNRMEDLEELMFREALRQSLATEEERRRKEEKEERKEAKKREKEERKASKSALKQQQQQGSSSSLNAASNQSSGHSSASGSSLSLVTGLGGRKRGNSGASNLRVEASVANAIAVSGGVGAAGSSGESACGNAASTLDKGKSVDRGDAPLSAGDAANDCLSPAGSSSTSGARAITSSGQPSAGPSHLRQMSSASSISSSQPESGAGSFQNSGLLLQDPRASGLSLGSRSATSEDGGEHGDERDRDPSASTEPMFNFSSLAELVGVQLEGENAGRRLSAIGRDGEDGAKKAATASEDVIHGSVNEAAKEAEASEVQEEHVEVVATRHLSAEQTDEQKCDNTANPPPKVTVTPGTPAQSYGFE